VEVLKLFSAWADKHVPHEKSMVGAGTDNADVDSVSGVPSCVTVNDVDAVSGVEVVDSTFSVDFPCLFGHGLVNRSPPDVVFRRRLLDYSLVTGRATGLLARVGR